MGATTLSFTTDMVSIATVRRPQGQASLVPVVNAGTHGPVMSPWLIEGMTPVDVLAQSTDKVLGESGNKASTPGIQTKDDGTVSSMNNSRALPEIWLGVLYGSKSGSSAARAKSTWRTRARPSSVSLTSASSF